MERALLDRASLSGELHSIWKTVLKKDIGEEDDFFDSGGDSLAALRMVGQVQSMYSVEIEVSTFFENPNIKHLVEMVLAAARAS